MDTTAMIRDLSRPEAFAPLLRMAPASVAHCQTHISVLFFTPEEVFKIKKPLDLGFLDFRTLASRRHFCEEELRLNRPLAPGVYKDLVPITQGEGGLRFGGTGEPIEWSVRMQRLPEDRMLDVLLRSGDPDSVTPAMMKEVATRVAAFHATAQPHPEAGSIESIERTVWGNLGECADHVGTTCSQAVYDYLSRRIRAETDRLQTVFAERAADGCVIDTHGDLHSEHICFTDPLVIYDRLEFSPEFRHTDVAAEIAFLAMDLDHRGRPDLTHAWLDAYRSASRIPVPQELLEYYLCHRALVRAKVLSIKCENTQIPAEERKAARGKAFRYFALAVGYAMRRAQPTWVVVCGPIASGKTTVAGWLAGRLGFEWFQSDAERKHLRGLEPTATPTAAQKSLLYTPEMTRRTYDRLIERAQEAAATNRSAILDATYWSKAERDRVRQEAHKLGIEVRYLFLTAPREELEARLRAREGQQGLTTDARIDLLPSHLAGWEVPGSEERDVVHLSGESADAVFEAALDAVL